VQDTDKDKANRNTQVVLQSAADEVW